MHNPDSEAGRILDTDDHVLSLGRSARFHTEAQRLALAMTSDSGSGPASATRT